MTNTGTIPKVRAPREPLCVAKAAAGGRMRMLMNNLDEELRNARMS